MDTNPATKTDSIRKFVVDTVGTTNFEAWRTEREFRENIQAGKPYLNTPPPVKPPEQHSPSQLSQCHRKIYYRQLNAPEETEDPDGIFWTGTKFEEEVVLPYLESVVAGRAYVRNSMWVDYAIETTAGEIQIRGSTDPVIVDETSTPILPTEVKTKDSIKNTTAPNEHHIAQLFAYMEGLSREWDTEVRSGLVIYGDRTNLSIKTFEVAFDQKQWCELVLEWAENHTDYRLTNQLPPAEPRFGWECKFCSFKQRCGRETGGVFADENVTGFLPGVRYPYEKVEAYLQSHTDATLTPTLAVQYPNLADRYGICDWYCEVESRRFDAECVDWDGNLNAYPVCPSCASQGILSELAEPQPEQQHRAVPDASGGNNR